jgi:hypothetical protein
MMPLILDLRFTIYERAGYSSFRGEVTKPQGR